MAENREFPLLHSDKRIWKISVDNNVIIREYGLQGGKMIVNRKEIKTLKSQTTLHQQAIFEAQSMWREMVEKKGYAENTSLTIPVLPTAPVSSTLPSASSHPLRVLARVGIKGSLTSSTPTPTPVVQTLMFYPMLANHWDVRKGYVKYPCHVQPKLDGVRYTAHMVNGVVELRTRSATVCPFFESIKTAIASLQLPEGVYLDGEFYSSRIPFRTLNGYCNRKKMEGKTGFQMIPPEDLASIHYNIFDCYFKDQPNAPFTQRCAYLTDLLKDGRGAPYLQLVPSTVIQTESEIPQYHQQFVNQGYEGIIIRNSQSPYKIKDRSNDLLKYKQFYDTEYEIVGANTPENGKEEGCIIWELRLPETEITFTCRPRDTYESRKADWQAYQDDPTQFVGKQYTVRYQETYENGVPRFPVGIAVREDL